MKSRVSLFFAYALLAAASILIASVTDANSFGATETVSLSMLALGAAALTLMTRTRRPR